MKRRAYPWANGERKADCMKNAHTVGQGDRRAIASTVPEEASFAEQNTAAHSLSSLSYILHSVGPILCSINKNSPFHFALQKRKYFAPF